MFNKNYTKRNKKKDKKETLLKEKLKKQLKYFFYQNKVFEKEVWMKHVVKHYPKKRSFLGINKINYNNY